MTGISKIQRKILEDLYLRDIKKEAIKIRPEMYELMESDEIMKVRELVYNMDVLIDLQLVDAEDKYYYESDFVSFEYMNKAVEIREERLKLSKLGIEYLEMQHEKGFTKRYTMISRWLNKQFMDRPYKYLITHLIAFLFGLAVMWGIMKLI